MQSTALLEPSSGSQPPSATPSAAPSRNSSFEHSLHALKHEPGALVLEFSSTASTSREDCLDNPLAKLLKIRSDIRNAPAFPGMRSFPVFAHPALANNTTLTTPSVAALVPRDSDTPRTS